MRVAGAVLLASIIALATPAVLDGVLTPLTSAQAQVAEPTAVRAFQNSRGFRETGVLAPAERAALAARSKEKQEQVGWRMVDDKATGTQVGLPTAQVPNTSPGRRGTRWSSAQGQVQVETFR